MTGVINVEDGLANDEMHRNVKTSQEFASEEAGDNQFADQPINSQLPYRRKGTGEPGAYNTSYNDNRPWHKRGTGKAQSLGSVHGRRQGGFTAGGGKPRNMAHMGRAIGTAGDPNIPTIGYKHLNDSRNTSNGLGYGVEMVAV